MHNKENLHKIIYLFKYYFKYGYPLYLQKLAC